MHQEAQDSIQALGAVRQLGPTATVVLGWDSASQQAPHAEVPTHHQWGGDEARSLHSWLSTYDPHHSLTALGADPAACSTLLQEAQEARYKSWLGRASVRTLRPVQAAEAGRQDMTAQRLSVMEAQWGRERAVKQARLDAVSSEASSLEIKASFLFNAAANTLDSQQRDAYLTEARQSRHRAAQLREQEVMARATVNTMPSSDGSLLKDMRAYDQQFMDDSQRVLSQDKRTLIGFDLLLREAWDEPALNDPDIIAFFDDYVIDSLAGFATDRTRATEPRVLYQGGDVRVKYALLSGGYEEPARNVA